MIRPRILRELMLTSPSQRERPHHLSAASGLVATGNFLYVVADDEHHLGVFPAHGDGNGQLIPIFANALPLPHKERKAAKADLEALAWLPPFAAHAHGALLLLGSGSKAQRCRGALLALDAAGAIAGPARSFDLGGLYRTLQRELPALNIEGAVVLGDELILLHRASRTHPINALIHLSLDAVAAAASGEGFAEHAAPIAIQHVVLDDVDGVALGFTDAFALADGRIVFTAAAENSSDTYHDGPCAGVAIGVLSREGHLQRLERVQPAQKIEGICARQQGEVLRLLLVTDADDATVPSQLLAAEFTLSD